MRIIYVLFYFLTTTWQKTRLLLCHISKTAVKKSADPLGYVMKTPAWHIVNYVAQLDTCYFLMNTLKLKHNSLHIILMKWCTIPFIWGYSSSHDVALLPPLFQCSYCTSSYSSTLACCCQHHYWSYPGECSGNPWCCVMMSPSDYSRRDVSHGDMGYHVNHMRCHIHHLHCHPHHSLHYHHSFSLIKWAKILLLL